jgi:hypothetical protein
MILKGSNLLTHFSLVVIFWVNNVRTSAFAAKGAKVWVGLKAEVYIGASGNIS